MPTPYNSINRRINELRECFISALFKLKNLLSVTFVGSENPLFNPNQVINKPDKPNRVHGVVGCIVRGVSCSLTVMKTGGLTILLVSFVNFLG